MKESGVFLGNTFFFSAQLSLFSVVSTGTSICSDGCEIPKQ